jgi:hypothetical protein
MPLFRLDEYNDAARRQVYGWIQTRALELAPSLKLFPRIEVEHVRTSRVTLPDGRIERIEPVAREDSGQIDIREVVDGRFEQLRESFGAAASESARAQVAYWEGQVDRGLTPGTMVKVRRPVTWDSIMDALEGLAIGFDEAGEPTYGEILGQGAARTREGLPPRDAKQERRWQALMDRKRQEWRARQRNRRMA